MIAIDIPKEQLRDFCRKWKITEFALFGSVTRPEEFGPESDVDVLVAWSDDAEWSVFDHLHMEDELKSIFGATSISSPGRPSWRARTPIASARSSERRCPLTLPELALLEDMRRYAAYA